MKGKLSGIVLVRILKGKLYASKDYEYVCPYCSRRGRRRVDVVIPDHSYPLGAANKKDKEELSVILDARNEKWVIRNRGCRKCQYAYNKLREERTSLDIDSVRRKVALEKWKIKNPGMFYFTFSNSTLNTDPLAKKFNILGGRREESIDKK